MLITLSSIKTKGSQRVFVTLILLWRVSPFKNKGCVNLFLHVVIQEGSVGFSAVVTVVMLGHETADSCNRRIFSKASDLSVGLNSVVLQGLHRNGLVHSLHLLGSGEDLLFALLTSSSETKDQVEGGLLLDVVVAQSASIFQLLSGKNQTLLIRRDSFLILDLSLDVVNGVRWLDIEGDGLAYQIALQRRNNEGVSKIDQISIAEASAASSKTQL